MKIFIGILLACSSLLQAQNLKLGFDIGFHQVKIDKANNSQNLGTEGLPLAAHLDLSFSPLKDISFLAQIGRTFDTEFKGWEFGIRG